MLGDTGQMCSDPSDTPVGKVMGTAATVLIGGGGGGSDEAREQASAAAMKAAATACHKWIKANMSPGAEREQAHRDVCTATGHPIDVATGKVFTKTVEVVLKGRIPLEIARNYSSARSDRGPLGTSWRHSWEIDLIEGREFVAMRDENGRFIPFAPVKRGESAAAAVGRFTLKVSPSGDYAVYLKSGLCYHFGAPRAGRDETTVRSLMSIEDIHGNRALLRYDDHERLVSFTDTAGRAVHFFYNESGLVTEMRLQATAQSPVGPVVCRYTYDNGLLVAAEDGRGGRWTYEYQGHLLVRESDRNRDSFYFRYDEAGWCIETWGDGGLLHRRLEYDRTRRCTLVTNGLGYRRLYHWNAQGVVEQQTDHEGHSLRFEYNEFIECIGEENALGHKWNYEYDRAGRLVALTRPDGVSLNYKWDDYGRLIEKVDPYGGKWSWEHDATGSKSIGRDPLGQETIEHRNQLGDVVKVVGPDGRDVHLIYDAAGNCVEMINGDGLHLRRVFDSHGDLLRESDQFGTRFETEYDERGFPEFVRQRGRGESRFLRDAEGRITRVTTSRGRCYEYQYLPFLNKVASMRQTSGLILADGSRVVPERRYTYDAEARLVRLDIDGERAAEFSYGEHHHPARIRYSDGREQIFERNPQGVITRFSENGEIVFTQEADAVGRVIHRLTGDGEEFFFDYDAMGRLVSGRASGETQSLEIERDELGRAVTQSGGAGNFEFDYDPSGHQTGYHCGEDLAVRFEIGRAEQSGHALTIAVNGRAEVALAFDACERLTAASFASGERHEYTYGNSYAPSDRRIARGGQHHAREEFTYDPAGLPIRCEHSNGTTQIWARDDRDRLVSAHEENSAASTAVNQRWGYDAVGDRVVTTASDGTEQRAAFTGHRPRSCGLERYSYDHRGRMITRTDATGATTRFHWNSLSQLRRAELADGRIVDYDYDVLGRRVAKRRGDEIDRFGWINNQLVHECTSGGDERHYLYQARSYAPLACLIADGQSGWQCHSVTTDCRGAPTAMTAASGREVWQADVKPWGERSIRQADLAMPLALPGQYEDAETGLFYNNARYYNPLTATYISPDPIGLAESDNCYQYVADPLSQIDPLGLNPENIALGLSSYKMTLPNGGSGLVTDVLPTFAANPAGDGSVRASMCNGFDKVTNPETGKDDLPARISKGMQDAKTIHFNLEGMNNVDDIRNNPDPSRFKPPSTDWELATVLSDPKLKDKTIFYDRPGVVSKQIPCG
jgi:RHS repeat-associated protein